LIMKILNRGLILLLFVCTSAFSQETVSGIVTDSLNNEPLAFVNIGIPQTGIGSVSDVEGGFILKLPQQVRDTDSVVFSFIGYDSRKKSVADLRQGKVEIGMTASEDILEEVVLEMKELKEKKLGRTARGLGLM